LSKGLAGNECRQLVVRNDADHENGLAGFNFVTVGESGFFSARAVQKCAVAASLIDDAAALFIAFDSEVRAGHLIVVGNGKLGPVRCAADH
jgi:hypothetical protein